MVYIFHRGTRFSRRRVFLLLGDILGISISLFLAVIGRLGISSGLEYIPAHWPSLFTGILIFLVVFYAGGMYEEQTVRRRTGAFLTPFLVCLIAMSITVLVLYARSQATIGRGILFFSTGGIFFCSYFLRRIYRLAVGYGLFMKHAIILADHFDRCSQMIKLMKRHTSPYKLFGIVACGTQTAAYVDGVPVLGTAEKLTEFIHFYNIETLLLSISASKSHELLGQLRPLRYAGVEIMDLISLYEELAQEIPLDHINDEWLMTAAMNSSIVQIRKVKRAMDLAVSSIGLVIGFVPMMICIALIKLTSPGPAIYRQTRVGTGSRNYTLYKLRTMRTDAEQHGAVWAKKQDSRVTRVGHFLRKWRLDEVPQLWNVIRGDMSLVGPRPERPEFTKDLAEVLPFYNERLLVQPGITGWAQIKFPYAASLEAAARKLQFDLFYIKHMSFIMDVSILLRTVKTILIGLRHENDVDFDAEEVSDSSGS